MNKKSGEIFVLLATICWSLSGVLTKSLTISPILSNALRSFIAVFVLLLFNKFSVKFNKTIFCAAVCGAITITMFFVALNLTSAANAIVIQYTAPIFVLLFTCLQAKRLPTAGQILVVVCAFLGVGIIFSKGLSGGGLWGNLAALIAGITFAGVFFINRLPGSAPVDSSIIAFTMCAFTGLFYVPQIISMTKAEWAIVLVLGLVQHGLAYVFFCKGIKTCVAFSASLIGMLETVLVPFWVFLVFKEAPSTVTFIGSSLIIFAVGANTVLENKKAKATTKPITN